MPRRPSVFANWWLLSRALATALIRIERLRRQLLFILTLLLLAMVALGAMPLMGFLNARPWLFFLYWGAVFALVIFVFLLALLDMLAVRQRYKSELSRLRHDYKDALQNEPRKVNPEKPDKKS